MKPTMTTRVPAQLDRLVELFEADDELDGVRIFDGTPLERPDESDVVVIAASTPEQPGVEVDYVEQQSLGRATYIEQATIIVIVSSWSGDEEMRPRRLRVQQIFGRMQQILAEHQVEIDVWDGVGFAPAAEWYFVPSEDGATAACGFAVVCRSVI